MLLTAMRKTECLKMEKKFINFDKGTLFIPKGISKTKYRDEELPITPELEVLLRNILDLGERPGLEFYKMRDFRWLFATRNWKAERYFNKEFRMSHKARLGGDEKYIPVLRKLMQEKANDPALLYAPKILRKTYITKSQQVFAGRSEIL
jgi:integrase